MPEPPQYLTVAESTAQFRTKAGPTQLLINQALHILHRLGVPLTELTLRRQERMALVFLAVVDVSAPDSWDNAKDLLDKRSLKTRDIIEYINRKFDENISPGSYDDIRRQDLLLPVAAGIVVPTSPEADPNSPTRGYALNPEYSDVIRGYGTTDWDAEAATFLKDRPTLAEELARSRTLSRLPITIPGGKQLTFGAGAHNRLIKAVIEEFLPRFGRGANVLYVGDADKKLLHLEEEGLRALNFFELAHGKLPDVVAHASEPNWLFLVEAVHTSGPVSELRHRELKRLTERCTADIIYVTAFQNRDTFRKHVKDIAWETEVWIADAPDHIIHFDGEKFLGPYDHLEA